MEMDAIPQNSPSSPPCSHTSKMFESTPGLFLFYTAWRKHELLRPHSSFAMSCRNIKGVLFLPDWPPEGQLVRWHCILVSDLHLCAKQKALLLFGSALWVAACTEIFRQLCLMAIPRMNQSGKRGFCGLPNDQLYLLQWCAELPNLARVMSRK